MEKGVTYSITNSRQVHPRIDTQSRLWSDIFPQAWKPFIQLSRIDMLSGSLLMFWPTVWGLFASAYRDRLPMSTVLYHLPFYFIGSVLLHSMACTWNDVCDKDLDAQVERTKHRPLPAGSVSVSAALMFALGQLVCFCCLLLLLSHPLAIKYAIFGLCVWQPIYPFLKRVTHWPQAWLPFVMNWGMVIAWVENIGREGLDVLVVFFLSSCCWSIYYDTIYATMDVKDDVKVGIKSTAVLFASWTRFILGIFSGGFIGLLVLAGVKNEQGIGYFGSISATGFLLIWQLSTWDLADPRSSFRRFDMNGRWVGKLVAFGLMVDYFVLYYM